MDNTSERRNRDRRQSARRAGADPVYTGPERRVSNRRSGKDRRREPRLQAAPSVPD